ncbi:MAG: glutathione S-transferase family protein [Xanthomonadaceae bacterium]|jgi:glutathione S-transferase|nr:glutathione S-transferase family protein [Xanthomonadaceae bacterium]
MKLFDSRRAPNPRRVRWCMAEKGIDDIEIVPVDLFKGEHRSPDFRARTGLARVPVLELDDGTAIGESIAICRYLESRHPEPNLFGHDAREIAIFEMWTRRAEMLLATPLMLGVRHGHPALAALEKQVPEFAASCLADAQRALPVFERRLGESAFLAGDRLGMADIVAFIGLDFARMVKFHPDESLVNLHRWADAMRQRPAATAGC